ncbi:MAG TPA: branched-chain amino acid ABC transporter permease [Alphaproteobacteria bacterium]|nr:branched-chain amino acid ABC transporter permease [Alphaproteobacteria bacterium]
MRARWLDIALALSFLAVAGLPFYAGDYAVGVGLSFLMWVALTQSWTVLSGLTGYVSIGHVVFYGLGAYVVVLLGTGLPLLVSLPLAGAAAFTFAMLIGYPVLRVRGPYFVILTFGLAELVKYGVIALESYLGKFSRIMFGGPSLQTLFGVMLVLAGLATALAWLVRRSRFGHGLMAIRENEEAAETIGIPIARFKLLAFALSSIVPGMVGGTMVLRSSYFEPVPAFDPMISLTMVTMAIIGGSDDIRGPILGAGLLVLVSEFLWARAPQVYMIIIGLLLIAFVLFAPGGVCGRLLRQRA